MTYTISKRYTQSIKLADGSLTSFTSELSTTVEVLDASELVAASDKLFAQVKWLTENDIANASGEING